MSKDIIFLNPVLKETVWGGSRLSSFGYELSSDKVGEAWTISAHSGGDCVVSFGRYAGLRLSELWKNHKELFGNVNCIQFPLLTKIIDAREDLSIQVHPDDEYALKNENGALGKTECWYILDCKDNASIIIGHNSKNKEELVETINGGRWSEFIREIPVKRGDFFFIPPGTVHAIKGGTLILETQQSSDVTYRVYDYGRLSGGSLRPLHIKQSIDVIKSPFEIIQTPMNAGKTQNKCMKQLVSCNYFTVWKLVVDRKVEIKQDQNFMLCSVIEGNGEIDSISVKKGMNFILPYNYGTINVCGNFEMIISAV